MLPFVATTTDLGGIILNQMSDSKRQIPQGLTCVWNLEKAKLRVKQNRIEMERDIRDSEIRMAAYK